MGTYILLRRYPILNYNAEINPDESQLLAQALTLWHHAIYWRFVDGATMGPLSSYFTALPALFGFPLDYLVARWLGVGCTLITLGAVYLSAVNLFGWRAAGLALLPAVAFTGYTQHDDFVHDTNEQLSLALISICLWQFSHLIRYQKTAQAGWLFWLTFTASLVPFAKLQGTPSVLVIVLAAFVTLLRQRKQLPVSSFGRAMTGFLAGGLAFPLIFVGLTVYFDVFDDFIQFYILGNAAYGSGNSIWVDTVKFLDLLNRMDHFAQFLLPTAGLLIGRVLWPARTDVKPGHLVFCLTLLFVNLYAIIKPGNAFGHYLLYLLAPVSLLNAYLIATIRLPLARVSIGLALLVCLTIAVNEVALWRSGQPFSQYRIAKRQMKLSCVADLTLKYARPGEDLVVWGWMPRYNVQTQMPQGVADNHVIRCLLGDPAVQRIHRIRYIQNIKRSNPPVFIDSVGENCLWLNDRSRFAHEKFPELNEYISKNYRWVGETEYTRVYVRIDRYKRIST
ncbi:MAG: hypothetical protein H7Z72_26195 [Bacteroidetes bacterium]|nr:hypothetical protein [Fibrella sp.]